MCRPTGIHVAQDLRRAAGLARFASPFRREEPDRMTIGRPERMLRTLSSIERSGS